jgi:hypothetical protein
MAAATPHAAAPPELRAGFEGLSLRKRRQKAEELGIPEAQIEAAEESDAPKEALLALLLALLLVSLLLALLLAVNAEFQDASKNTLRTVDI